MKIKLYNDLCKVVDVKILKKLGIEFERSYWQKFHEVDLVGRPINELKDLMKAIEPHTKPKETALRGAARAYKDLNIWINLRENTPTGIEAKTVEKFCALLIAYLETVPGHRIFQQDENLDSKLCYYVGDISYYKKVRHRNYVTPAHVKMSLYWIEYGGVSESSVTFWPPDCLNMSVSDALILKGYLAETDELREMYLEERRNFHEWTNSIGRQFLAVGVAEDESDSRERSWWRRANEIVLDKDGVPSKVVVDVFSEGDENRRDNGSSVPLGFWKKDVIVQETEEDEEEEQSKIGHDEYFDGGIELETPLHPMLICFDLRRHMRLKLHISQLTEYVYDKKLGEKLILPDEHLSLIKTLLNYRKGFKDIVKGKGNGIIVLCAGPPGTGKTLTSEAFAEFVGMPLYSVQCSQLGVDAEQLEEELLKIFTRAQRWNAILLLDEADVYVASRGRDLIQNGIVGVFLRTLEYYNGVMFLTTNRSDLVDDAVASRCVARIRYEIPDEKNQRKIWTILSETSGMTIKKSELDKIVEKHQNLSGRDIKNLLKLTLMMIPGDDKEVTLERIDFVKQFKPTAVEVKKLKES